MRGKQLRKAAGVVTGAGDTACAKAASSRQAALAWPEGVLTREEFIDLAWRNGDELYRDLPWRRTRDPYAVLVSEIMLQQTQVSRVEKYWARFMAAFPTVDALAAASVADVLEMWQGLGYNRRALALKRAADTCAAEHAGQLPSTYEGLLALPGVGPATAAGVMAFSHGLPSVYIETNVRAVFLQHLFPDVEKVSDKELWPLVEACCPPAGAPAGRDVRAWYYALLDWGSQLKAHGANPSRKSAHYARQSAFEGSRRQKRAWILRRVLAQPEGVPECVVHDELNVAERKAGREAVGEDTFASIVADLIAEGFFARCGGMLVP